MTDPLPFFILFRHCISQSTSRLFFSIHEPVNLLFRKLSLWSNFATKLVSTRKPSGRLSTDNRIDVKPSPFNRLFFCFRLNKKVKEKSKNIWHARQRKEQSICLSQESMELLNVECAVVLEWRLEVWRDVDVVSMSRAWDLDGCTPRARQACPPHQRRRCKLCTRWTGSSRKREYIYSRSSGNR